MGLTPIFDKGEAIFTAIERTGTLDIKGQEVPLQAIGGKVAGICFVCYYYELNEHSLEELIEHPHLIVHELSLRDEDDTFAEHPYVGLPLSFLSQEHLPKLARTDRYIGLADGVKDSETDLVVWTDQPKRLAFLLNCGYIMPDEANSFEWSKET